jgi:hypothetical protein
MIKLTKILKAVTRLFKRRETAQEIYTSMVICKDALQSGVQAIAQLENNKKRTPAQDVELEEVRQSVLHYSNRLKSLVIAGGDLIDKRWTNDWKKLQKHEPDTPDLRVVK